jgi:cytosine/uracil/thiamine/allantoin permease
MPHNPLAEYGMMIGFMAGLVFGAIVGVMGALFWISERRKHGRK